jgi:Protein of unknown function (DUF2905)
LRQPIHIAADLHVGLKLTAVQLFPEMLAQRRLANLKLSSYLGLGDTKGRSTLHKRALGIGRHIFGGHFTFPIAQPRDARALYGKLSLRNDIIIKRENFTFYMPITTGILVSVVLSLLLWLMPPLHGLKHMLVGNPG